MGTAVHLHAVKPERYTLQIYREYRIHEAQGLQSSGEAQTTPLHPHNAAHTANNRKKKK